MELKGLPHNSYIAVLNLFFSLSGLSVVICEKQIGEKVSVTFKSSLIWRLWKYFLPLVIIFYAAIYFFCAESEINVHFSAFALSTATDVVKKSRMSMCVIMSISILLQQKKLYRFVRSFNNLNLCLYEELDIHSSSLQLLLFCSFLSSMGLVSFFLVRAFLEERHGLFLESFNYCLYFLLLKSCVGMFLVSILYYSYFYDTIKKTVSEFTKTCGYEGTCPKRFKKLSKRATEAMKSSSPYWKTGSEKSFRFSQPKNSKLITHHEKFVEKLREFCVKIFQIYEQRSQLREFLCVPICCILLFSVFSVITSSYYFLVLVTKDAEAAANSVFNFVASAVSILVVHSIPQQMAEKVTTTKKHYNF